MNSSSIVVPERGLLISAPDHILADSRSLRWKILLILMLASSATEFVARGSMRFANEGFAWNDFISPFVQSRAWVDGEDPYNSQELVRRWPKDAVRFAFLQKDAGDGTLLAKRGVPSPYPITSFVLLAPLSPLSWRVAHRTWLFLMVFSFAVGFEAMRSVATLGWHERRTYAFLAVLLALAPFHTAIAAGNIVMPAFAAAMASLSAATRKHVATAGILLAITMALKPPVGLVFLTYYLVRRRWGLVLISVELTATLVILAALRSGMSGANWTDTYVANNAKLFARGAINDFTTFNSLRFHMLNLQIPLYSLTGSVTAANAIAWSAAGLLFLIWLRLISRQNRGNPLLALSALAFIALLPVYHRFVDAVLLALPLCWAFTAREPSLRRIRNLTLALAAPFLFPGAAMLVILAEKGVLPASITTGWWWNTVLMPHQVWAVFCISVMLLFAMAVEERSRSKSQTPGLTTPVRPRLSC